MRWKQGARTNGSRLVRRRVAVAVEGDMRDRPFTANAVYHARLVTARAAEVRLETQHLRAELRRLLRDLKGAPDDDTRDGEAR